MTLKGHGCGRIDSVFNEVCKQMSSLSQAQVIMAINTYDPR